MRKAAKSALRRRRPTQRRAQHTVEAILDAVILLLKRGGVSAITTNSIAEAAGVSIGSVYQYFPDKRAIFIALHERHIRQVDQVLQRKISESEGATLDRLVASLLDGMIEVHGSDPQFAALLDSEVPHRADGTREFSIRLHELFRKALAPYQERPGAAMKLHVRAFLLGNMLEALGHAVVLRRPPMLSLRSAKMEAGKAILASLRS
jgi:AcrR family transcriptional regulator